MGEVYVSVLVPSLEQIREARNLNEIAELVRDGTNVCRVLRNNEAAYRQTAMAVNRLKQFVLDSDTTELHTFEKTFPQWILLIERVEMLFPELGLAEAVKERE